MNQDSTGFFMVDHVLLRKRNQYEWGLYLYDKDFKILLQNNTDAKEEQLKIISYNILLFGSQLESYDLTGNDKEGYQVVLYDEKKNLVMKSPTKLKHKEAQNKQQQIHQLISKIKNENPAKISELLFLQKKNEVEEGTAYTVPTNFFNFQLSFIFPKWLKRFFNREHRTFVKNLILENVPAHLRANFYWLSISDMQTFEQHYKNWLNLLPNAEKQPHELENASAELVKFLVETDR